jgi:hypothetical protein
LEISVERKQEDYAVEHLIQMPPQTMFIKMCGLYRVKRQQRQQVKFQMNQSKQKTKIRMGGRRRGRK